jgi:protein-tyrosine-phosphatase
MRRIGYDLSQHRSKSLVEIPDIEFDFVATLGGGDECPLVRAKLRENWNLPDPKDFSEARCTAVRDKIESEVVSMLLELRIAGHLRWESGSV